MHEERDDKTYMAPKAVQMPFALEFPIDGRDRFFFHGQITGTTFW